MALNRAAIHYDNLIPAATLTATSEASASMGVEKLKTSSPRERWRSVGVNDQTITATTGSAEFWPLVHAEGLIISPSGTARIRISDNADLSAPVYDCTFNALPSISGWGEGGYGMGGYGGFPIFEEMETWQFKSTFLLDLVLTGSPLAATATTLTLPVTLGRSAGKTEPASRLDGDYLAATVYIIAGTGVGQSRAVAGYSAAKRVLTLDAPWSIVPDGTSVFDLDLSYAIERRANDGTYSGKYLGVTLSDAGSVTNYIEAGVLMAGDYLQPEYDIDQDYNSGWDDPSEQLESYGQEVFIDERNMRRMAGFSYRWLTEDEANQLVNRMGPKVGRRKPFLVLPFFESSSRLYDDAIYGISTGGFQKSINPAARGTKAWQVSFNVRGL